MKPGYKKTEVGVIPEEWEVKKLTDLLCYGPKNGYSGKSGKKSRGTPTLSLGATSTGCMILNEETTKRLDQEIDQRSELYLKPGDVLVQRSNTAELVGTTAVFNGPAETYVYPDLMMRVRFRDEATAHWFWRYANSDSGRRFFVSVAAGSSGSMPKISGEKLRAMQLPHPPLPEQRAIATTLSDVDALLAALEQLIAKKRDLKQAAMQQLLTGQTRLSGFKGKWETKRLGDVASFLKGKGLPKGDITPYGEHPCIHYGELFTRYPETITEIISRTNKTANTMRSVANDVLMPTSDVTPRGLAKASCVTADGVILGGDILVIRSDATKVCGSFLSYVIRREESQVLQLVTGTTVFHLYGSDMKKFTLNLPPLLEQAAIATVLSDMDAELANLEQRLEKTRALKQGMMQELLTGKTRLI